MHTQKRLFLKTLFRDLNKALCGICNKELVYTYLLPENILMPRLRKDVFQIRVTFILEQGLSLSGQCIFFSFLSADSYLVLTISYTKEALL